MSSLPGIDPDILVEYLKQEIPDLWAVYVFGSFARGDCTSESDLDVAFLCSRPLDSVLVWNSSGHLAEIVGRHVDLVDLRSASTVMQYQIITTGICVLSNGVETELFEAMVLSEKTTLDERRSGLLSDIAREGSVYAR